MHDIYYIVIITSVIIILTLPFIIDKVVFPRVKLEAWDKDEWLIKVTHGISYIYDRPDVDSVVIFSHGNSNLAEGTRMRNLIKDTGLGFLMYDYYGYGASEDDNEETIFMNFIQESTFTRSIAKMIPLVHNKKVIIVGSGLGAYPSCWLASLNLPNVIGLILCVPFDSLNSFSRLAQYTVGSYDNYSLGKLIKVPTLIIEAEYDKVVPKYCGRRLSSVIKESRIITVPESHKSHLNALVQFSIKDFIKMLKS